MTIFDVLNDVCNKKSYSLDKDISWADNRLSPYMLQRWTSMTSPINAFMVNEFSNIIGAESTNDAVACYYLLSAIAQPNRTKIKYIKKQKQQKEALPPELEAEKQRMSLSNREVKMYNNMLKNMS